MSSLGLLCGGMWIGSGSSIGADMVDNVDL